jgi:hypothetical protein
MIMNPKLSPICRILATFLLVLVALAPAGLQAQNNNRNKKNKVYPLTRKGAASELPTVKSVGGGMITVGDKTYEVPTSARITVNGKPAELGAIKPGMQASVSGGVSKYGKTKSDTIYKATRISARGDNKLEQKRKEYNKKQAERAREINRRNNKNRNRR